MAEQEATALPPDGTGAAETSWTAFPVGIRLELVVVEPPAGLSAADLLEPFVALGNRGRFSRTLLARTVGPTNGVVREVALKLQRDDYPLADLSGWSNCDVDNQWGEQDRLWRVAAASDAAAAVVDVLPRPADGGPCRLPATLYCKERRAFFATPCPECGARLETCKENGLLEQHGLPRYDDSLERFLYCPACRAAARPPRFYTLILSDARLRERAPVGEQTDLYRALRRLACEGGPLPCAGCAHVPSCYPADGSTGNVTRLLTPLSFYEYRCLPLERLHLHYDDFARMLGGRQLDASARLAMSPADGSAPLRRYLFEGDPRGKLPLEILRLKLILFSQLLSAVSNLHRTTQLPHLALSPENIMVEIGAARAGLPSFYNFRARLLGVGKCRRRRFDGLDTSALAVPVLEPPPVRDAAHAAPLLTVSQTPSSGSLTLRSAAPVGPGRMVIEGELASDMYDVRTLRTKDTVHVTVRQGRPLPLAVEFLAHPGEQRGATVVVRSAPVHIDDTTAQQLRTLSGQGAIRATFAVYPCFHVPCDVQSLGLLLFTTLLTNTTHTPAAIAAEVRGLGERVGDFARQHPEASADELWHVALGALREAETDGWLAPSQLVDLPSEHRGIPTGLGSGWRAALMLGLRAFTQVAGFGFCRGHDDFDPAHPEGPVDHLKADLDILGHSIDAELLAMHGKRREITEAIDRVRRSLVESPACGARQGQVRP
jgi:hypothetical protein